MTTPEPGCASHLLTVIGNEWVVRLAPLVARHKKRLRDSRAEAKRLDHYHPVFAMMFDPYIRRHFRKIAQRSPSLADLDPKIYRKVASCNVEIIQFLRRFFVLMAVLIGAYIYVSNHYPSETVPRHVVEYTSLVLLYGVEVLYPWWKVRRLYEQRAIIRLFRDIRWLETTSEDWHSSSFRWRFARSLEALAKSIERIPLASRGIASSVRHATLRVSRTKAQAIRELEFMVIRPESLTAPDLLERLTNDLKILADGRWYALPDGHESDPERPRWIIFTQVSASILIIGAAIFFATIAAKLGPVYSIVAALLLGAGVVLLNGSGLSTASLSDALKQMQGGPGSQ